MTWRCYIVFNRWKKLVKGWNRFKVSFILYLGELFLEVNFLSSDQYKGTFTDLIALTHVLTDWSIPNWRHLMLKMTFLHCKQESKGLALKNRTNGGSLQQNTQNTGGTSLMTRLSSHAHTHTHGIKLHLQSIKIRESIISFCLPSLGVFSPIQYSTLRRSGGEL